MNPAINMMLTDGNFDVVETVVEVAEELSVSPSQVSLAWARLRPGVTSPIFGARTMEQLEDNLGAADLQLDDATLKRLDDVSRLQEVYPYGAEKRAGQLLQAMNFEEWR